MNDESITILNDNLYLSLLIFLNLSVGYSHNIVVVVVYGDGSPDMNLSVLR